MSRIHIPITEIGSKFVLPSPRLRVITPLVASESMATMPASASVAPESSTDTTQTELPQPQAVALTRPRPTDIVHQYSLAGFALLFLVVGTAGIQVGGHYWWSVRSASLAKPVVALKSTPQAIAGLNMTVASDQLQPELQTITGQPATLTVGTQAVPISSSTIRSWLQITSNKTKSAYYLHINEATISASLVKLADQSVKAPVNQVTVNEAGVEQVVVYGRDGTTLSNPSSLTTQAQQAAKTVMGGKGLQFSTPIQTAPFQSVTPVAFSKLIDVNLTTKQMYLFQNGQQVQNYAVSAGAPATPTPVGEFHIYAKYTVQNMSGYNVNGTKYFQPNVPWVNYFSGADAVHGVYWHPLSWFGAINSSHGCVGVPVSDGEWIYDWAPIGTTVITHA